MQTKNLIVLALVGVVVLTGALIVATARKGDSEGAVATRMPRKELKVPTPRPSEGTMTGSSAQTSVEVQADNVQTSVQVR